MWLGLALGLFYCVSRFRATDVTPRLRLEFGPFKDGYLRVCGRDVYHWMVAIPACAYSIFLGSLNMLVLSTFMLFHGLMYTSVCGAVENSPAHVIEMDSESDLSDDDSESDEIVDVTGVDKEVVEVM